MKKILFLAANPIDTKELDLTVEYKQIKTLLQQSRQGDDFVLDYTPAASAEDLQQQLLSFKPDIVHFSGHGETDGLCFQGDDQKTHIIHQDSLSDFFSLFRGRIQCVVLNACYSWQQAEVIAQHIDYVIGMNTAIGDEAAIKFAQGFYRALFNGETIADAYKFGCSAIDLANIPECQTPVLFNHPSLTTAANNCNHSFVELESPGGIVPLDSHFYVERPPIENDCYNTIEKPYALIRIKAPRQMGKSSLLARVLNHAAQQGQRTVWLSLQEADGEVFATLDNLLKWFCTTVADELGLPDRLDELWKGVLGAPRKATNYVERYLLQQSASLTLGLDEVDKVFEHEKVASDFFGLLRAWHEKSKSDPAWKNLRLIITHSKEVYIPLNINQSPFNVGSAIELPEFTRAQVSDLLGRYQLHWSSADLERFIQMVGGHPFLVQLGLYEIARQRLTLTEFLRIAATEEWLYCDHLRRHLLNLQEAGLTAVAKQVMNTAEPVQIDSNDAFKLHSMGLVRKTGNKVQPLCQLYCLYFKERL